MLASCLVFLGLAMVGVPAEVAKDGLLTGIIVDAEGQPALGVEVLATGGAWANGLPEVTARGTTDVAGRFSMALKVNPDGCDRPMLWAYRPGSMVAWHPIDCDSFANPGVRLTLGRAGLIRWHVEGPDGRAVAGARVIPRKLAGDGPPLPEILATWTAAETDAQGQATLSAFRPEDLVGVVVRSDGFGTQPRDFLGADGLAELGPRSVTLRAVGRVSGRVVASDPKAVAGLSVRVASSWNGVEVGFDERLTDPSGRFDFPNLAAGSLTVRVSPRDGSPELPARVVRRELGPGQAVEAEIPLRRGVRVTGVVLEKGKGQPVAGAVVSVIPSALGEPRTVWTDAEGRYETYVPAGSATHRVLKVPGPYLCPPRFVGPRPVDIPAAIAGVELPPIELVKGGRVVGFVLDDDGQPVSGARVSASWTLFEGRNRTPRTMASSSRADGSFVVEPVDPDAELTVLASSGQARTEKPTLVKASDENSVRLTLADADGVAPTGRVVDLEGRPIAGALVRILRVDQPAEASVSSNFSHSHEFRTDAAGRFQGGRELHRDREYRPLVTADGYLANRGGPFRSGQAESLTIPDLVLTLETRKVTIEGRILDRGGRPIAGAALRTISPTTGRTSSTGNSGVDGRFLLEGVAEEKAFLFAALPGYRFQGRVIDPAAPGSDLTLTRVDEAPQAPMVTLAGGPEASELALRVIAPYVDRVLSQGDHSTRVRTLEMLASIEPRRVLAMIDAQGVEDAWFADHLRAASIRDLLGSGVQVEDVRQAIEAIQDAGSRTLVELEAADSLPPTAPSSKRAWIERALRDARATREPSEKVEALGQVADRLIDLGDVDRARTLLDEARPVAEALPCATTGGRARCGLVGRLARLDPARALALTEDLVDPADSDDCRLEVAIAVASRDPAEAARIVSTLRDSKALAAKIPAIAHAMARTDPALARSLINRLNKAADPCVAPYALGMMASAVARVDKPLARKWLLEAFDRLEAVATDGSPRSLTSRDPAAVAAALLPVVERVDGSLVTELFWRSASFHRSIPNQTSRSQSALTILLARYDRATAGILLDPLVDQIRRHTLAESDFAPVLEALAALDPHQAVRLVESFPEASDLSFHQPKNAARLTLSAALAREGHKGWSNATSRLLQFWTTETHGGE